MDFEVNATREVFHVVKFGHQIQPVQSFHRQVVFRQKVEFEIHTCGRLSVMREPAGTVIHVCSVNTQRPYPSETEMLVAAR